MIKVLTGVSAGMPSDDYTRLVLQSEIPHKERYKFSSRVHEFLGFIN